MNVYVVGVLYVALAFWLLVILANLPFGADALFWGLHAHTTAEPAPQGRARVLQVGSESATGLAHGVYERPEAIEAVVAAVVGRLSEDARQT
jgi:hypothetical protein